MTEPDDQNFGDPYFDFHQAWASHGEEPLTEEELHDLFKLVGAKYDLSAVTMSVDDRSPDNDDDPDAKRGYAWFHPEDQSIHVRRRHMHASTLLHEIAHALTQDQAPNWHGREMLDRFLELIREYMGEETYDRFAGEFRNYRSKLT